MISYLCNRINIKAIQVPIAEFPSHPQWETNRLNWSTDQAKWEITNSELRMSETSHSKWDGVNARVNQIRNEMWELIADVSFKGNLYYINFDIMSFERLGKSAIWIDYWKYNAEE